MGHNELAALLGTLAAVFTTWNGILHRRLHVLNDVLAKLSTDYVPREQVDARLAGVNHRWERETARIERRQDQHYEKMDSKLDKILDKLDHKVDKGTPPQGGA